MELYTYISLHSFVEGCMKPAGEPAFILQAENLLYTVAREEYQYGLSLLRKAIGEYEVQKGIPKEESKQAIPFFREKRRMLIGPEMDLYKLSFYEDGTFLPGKVKDSGLPYLRLSLDYEQLAEHCLFENMFLIRCKYDEGQVFANFVTQMEREYDKFFFDEEHSGFTADSRFFSLLCNACLEVKNPACAPEKEWRLTVLRNPADAGYRYEDGQLRPFVPISLPLNVIRKVTLLDSETEELNFSALAGFMQQVGLSPERYLEGLLEQ
ncbi:hypothetical protein [Parabacteroides faecis]|uniref:Uncharacterized protein n=1 Tax=Parabacteroides faecis TaxID=1217282 RepID=A0ABR6KPN9_9BACT|nr:hypothetical protein [Parabacteroides faecis]MBB4623475.1 hypothetical protein [Parabacteroides faecis]GGK00377.1 hypothetical protein GCM10007084_24730 [Parabacteroides faecis]